MVVLENSRDASKMCSRCGTIVEKSLSDRVHECLCCGLSLDRDQNAAINVLRLGMKPFGIVKPYIEAPAL
ncbi:MAG: transposase [Methanotrichaceae archaeon]|nr:transposase [Methanotrichaceae archaeon]